MREIPLTQGRVTIVDDEDFEWLSKWKWHFTFYGYAARRDGVTDEMFYMHREILGLALHEKTMVDHINLNRLDNRRENIRKCNKCQNSVNRPVQRNNTTGYRGVQHACRSKTGMDWIARIKVSGKNIHLGSYKTPEEAAAAYDRAMVKHHGDFARPNLQEAVI